MHSEDTNESWCMFAPCWLNPYYAQAQTIKQQASPCLLSAVPKSMAFFSHYNARNNLLTHLEAEINLSAPDDED